MSCYLTKFIGVFINRRKKDAFSTAPRDFSVLSFRIKGSAVFYREGETIHVSEKEILYVPENISYSQESDSEDEIIAIHFKINKDISDTLLSLTPKDATVAEGLFKKIYALYTENPKKNHFSCLSLIYEILGLFISGKEKNYPAPLLKALELFQSSYHNPSFSISSVSEELKISDAYLRILFSKHLNISPAAYLKSLRFDRAKRLLSTGYYSVKTVSTMCGYENEKNFSIAFKNTTGKSPSEYKSKV